MSTYVEELVQEIYTKCDTSGLDKLNKSTQFAIFQTEALGKNLAAIQAMQKSGYSEIAKNLKSSVSSIGALNQGIRFANKENLKGIDLTKQTYLGKKYQIGIEAALNNERIKTAFLEDKYNRLRKKWQEDDIKRAQRQTWLQRYLGKILVTTLGFQAIKGVVDTASRIQLLQKSIQGLTKSSQDWEYIKTQAFEKGIDLEVVAKGYRNFYSSAKMAGFDKGGIQQMYSDMLLSTRAIGASTQQTEGALLALEQMLSKGRVSMEELRKQMGNAIPGAFEIGARAMNMTTAEFNTFVQKVGLASNVFVPKFIEQLKKEYAGGFKGVSETLSFATGRLSVAWKLFQAEIFEGESGKAFAKGIDTLAKLMISPEFQQLAKILGEIFEWIAKIFSAAIKNLTFTIALVGSAGLTRGIIMLTKALETMGIKGVKAFLKLVGSTALLYGQWLLLFAIAAAIQDVIYGLFLRDVTESVTEDLLQKFGIIEKDKPLPSPKKQHAILDAERLQQLNKGIQGRQGDDVVYTDEKGKTMFIPGKYMTQFNNWSNLDPGLQNYLKGQYGTLAPNQLLPSMELNKTDTNTWTMGDVNIYVQGSTNPQETAQATYDSFFTWRNNILNKY